MPRSCATCIRDLLVTEGRMESERLVTYFPSFVTARKLLVVNSST